MIHTAFWQDKNVFVTGHTGFKGAWLSLWLHRLGAKVTGYALAPPTVPNMYEICQMDQLISSTTADIRDGERLTQALAASKAEIVFHLAAQPLVSVAYKTPKETLETNILGTIHMLEAIRTGKQVRVLVNITSDKCYKDQKWLWGYRENDALGGYDPYSASKACAELVIAAYRDSFFHTKAYESHRVGIASARAGNVIGGGDWAPDRLVPDCFRAVEQKKRILLRQPQATRPWQHVLDPLSGYLLLAEKLWENGPEYSEAWNFGPEARETKSVEWLVNRLYQRLGIQEIPVIQQVGGFHETAWLQLDCSRAKRKLGWCPQWDVGKAVDKTVEWMQAYYDRQSMRTVCYRQIEEYLAENG
ncbi:CDP-glucose 4,6-dehydratase [Propionispora sp. 2/2-37]|uniref:CDP-glucose 4,6-dehydratase n=1 Tax=Propionispora sp. 2/2-37 TaxID=1677858 RepID=UPI0006BB6145|nr:CDP-glucose 4,6-dehydratase [Propionispora sp. 2/2-37]CUH95093.1 CDP-glucose 4,6-dehydratase [Propionispora sp. 2/2-37]